MIVVLLTSLRLRLALRFSASAVVFSTLLFYSNLYGEYVDIWNAMLIGWHTARIRGTPPCH